MQLLLRFLEGTAEPVPKKVTSKSLGEGGRIDERVSRACEISSIDISDAGGKVDTEDDNRGRLLLLLEDEA